jgi:hypothetical protein
MNSTTEKEYITKYQRKLMPMMLDIRSPGSRKKDIVNRYITKRKIQ